MSKLNQGAGLCNLVGLAGKFLSLVNHAFLGAHCADCGETKSDGE